MTSILWYLFYVTMIPSVPLDLMQGSLPLESRKLRAHAHVWTLLYCLVSSPGLHVNEAAKILVASRSVV